MYEEVTSLKDSVVSVEQENPDYKFIYDCYCKKQKSEKNTEKNKSKVEITKIDEQTFNFKQTVIDEVIIDCEFKNLTYFCVDLEQSFYTKPIEIPIKFCDFFLLNISQKKNHFYISIL